jgi:hypothetical protein
MANPGGVNFGIPADIRALAEKGVEGARQAFETFVTAATQAASTAGKQMQGAQVGAREVGDLAVRFAEKNISASFALAEQLVRAKDAGEVVALHADFVKRQIAALADQAAELGRQAAKFAGSETHH